MSFKKKSPIDPVMTGAAGPGPVRQKNPQQKTSRIAFFPR